ncbi:metal-dependent hydrolase family protein [Acrocarpospora catenulata]|uniref:metal-dependent hydrolase family protein n=1 Tax=Acrocarpospora catenulata TaxID=2836182 RepID=UPI001BDB015E|nr:amidohydrolase family protein [Acrocarpospora catenulata]
MRTLIVNAVLLDGTGADPVPGASVLVEGDRIVEIDVTGTARRPSADLVVDAGGGTLMPGLIDLHVHFLGSSQTASWTEIDKTLYGVEQGRLALDAGITTARDVGAKEQSIFALRDHFADGRLDGPRVLACGAMIAMTGGHGSPFNTRECDGPDEVRKGTREQLRAGADWIKISATGGAATANEKITSVQFDPEEMRMAVHEATKAGKYVCAHAHAALGIRQAVQAGVRTIEHGVFIDDETAAVMLEHGAWLVPTLSAYVAIVEQGPAFGIPAYMQDKARMVTGLHVQSVARAYQAGVPIAFGTDAAGRYNPIGRSVVREVELLTEAGMPLAEVARSATSVAAEALGIADTVGTVEVGKRADLIILAGDPLRTAGAYRSVSFVMSGGVVKRRLAFDR